MEPEIDAVFLPVTKNLGLPFGKIKEPGHLDPRKIIWLVVSAPAIR
jgi:hypothetical protein